MATRTAEFAAMEKEYHALRERIRRRPPPSEEEIYGRPTRVSPLDSGHDVIDNIFKKLNTLARSELQVQLHKNFVKCCSHVLYGGDVVANHQLEIMEKWKWNDLHQELIVTAPRRFGKSWAVAMFACAVALSKKNVEISIFSTSSRASGSDGGLMSIIKKLIKGHFGIGREYIGLDNDERLSIKFAENDVRKINAFPGSVHT